MTSKAHKNRKTKDARPGWHGRDSKAWKVKFSCRTWRRTKMRDSEVSGISSV